MANPTVVINSVSYPSCGEVDIPKSGGGTAKYFYTADANAAAADILTGKTAFGSSGSVSGSMANNGGIFGTIGTKDGSIPIPTGYTSGGSVSLLASAVADLTPNALLAGKTVLGVSGSLQMPNISQDATTKILSIS